MVFSSIIFLFFFLPLTLLIYPLVGKKLRNLFLLTASLTFYAWGEGIYILVMLASILVNYVCGRMIVRREGDRPSRAVLVVAVVLNLCLLGFFKYGNFILDNVNSMFALIGLAAIPTQAIHLPIGISFFTFQALSYVVDVYRRKVVAQDNLIKLGLYISMFPQLIAGPIVRYEDIAAELINRKINRHGFASGVQRFTYGLGKKVLLANPMAAIADKIFLLPSEGLSTSLAWLGAVCYTLQIYFDFSGYSDMAIGLGRMFGFHFPENFNYPYISKSIREFWRRWHISLSSWLRDYLYIPLGGNRMGPVRTYQNLFVVFLLCGLWHGASWTFILWGIYHGFFLILERTRMGEWLGKLWQPLQHVLTVLIVMVGWVLFRSETIGGACGYIGAMFGFDQLADKGKSVTMYLDNKAMVEICLAIIFSMPAWPFVLKIKDAITDQLNGPWRHAAWNTFHCTNFFIIVIIIYAAVISLAAGVYNPFIYFRF